MNNLKKILLITYGFKTKLDSIKKCSMINIVENYQNKNELNLAEFKAYKTSVLKKILPNIDEHKVDSNDDILFLLEKEGKYTNISKNIVFNQIGKFFEIINALFNIYGHIIDIKTEVRALEALINNTDENFSRAFSKFNYLIEKKHMFLDKKLPNDILKEYLRKFLRFTYDHDYFEYYFQNLKDNCEFLFNDKYMIKLAEYNMSCTLSLCLDSESEDYKQTILKDIFDYENGNLSPHENDNKIKTFIKENREYFIKLLSKNPEKNIN